MSTLAVRVKEAIDAKGAERLAEEASLSRATLYNIAKGALPSTRTLKKLRDAGISIPRNILDAA